MQIHVILEVVLLLISCCIFMFLALLFSRLSSDVCTHESGEVFEKCGASGANETFARLCQGMEK